MKNFFLFAVLLATISCKKDNETMTDLTVKDSTRMTTLDSIQIPTFRNTEKVADFSIIPQDVLSEKGRVIFTQNGQVIFYYDQNAGTGNIVIDGQYYALDQTDFNENNYKLSGPEVEIEATGGAFADTSSDCISGNFPEVKVEFKEKTLNLTDIEVKDCPAN